MNRCFLKGRSNIRKASLTSKKLTQIIAEIASDMKALDICILDMRKVVNFCDYFVICSGNTDRQVKAVADSIEEGLSDLGVAVGKPSGSRRADWIVFDMGDIIVHVFEKDMREFYALEHLWSDAKQVKWQGNE